MHPLVRDAYKRLLHAGRVYPAGLDAVRARAKAEFRANAAVTDEIQLRRLVNRARWWSRELQAVDALRKYRAMRSRYTNE